MLKNALLMSTREYSSLTMVHTFTGAIHGRFAFLRVFLLIGLSQLARLAVAVWGERATVLLHDESQVYDLVNSYDSSLRTVGCLLSYALVRMCSRKRD